jgi:hypothetical protein
MSDKSEAKSQGADKASVSLPGTVQKIIPPIMPGQPEKAEIAVHAADELYREIRVENTLQDSDGNDVSLKKGADVEVTIEAEPGATTPKP